MRSTQRKYAITRPTIARPVPAELAMAPPVNGGGSMPVEVGPTGVAVADPDEPVERVPLVTGPTELGKVPLPPLGSGVATVESVLEGQYVDVETCVYVVVV